MRALLCVVATAAALSGSARPPPRPPRGKSKGRSRAQRRGNGSVPPSVPRDESIDAREARLAAKFAAFQGKNDHVVVDYAPSDFVRDAADELDVLGRILEGESTAFNALVDLCGVFKRSSVHEVRDRVRAVSYTHLTLPTILLV